MVIQKSITNDFFNFSNLILQTAFSKKFGLILKLSVLTKHVIKELIAQYLLVCYQN